MTKEEICQFVYSTRKSQGMSQDDLAERSGRKRLLVLEVEKNMVDFRISTLFDLLKPLGYTLQVVPQEQTGFDFSKIKPAKPEQPIGPFPKRKTKAK